MQLYKKNHNELQKLASTSGYGVIQSPTGHYRTCFGVVLRGAILKGGAVYGTKYSRVDYVKFVEDSL